MSVRVSLAWTYVAQATSFLLTFSSTIVVARIVSPRDFGIFAMAAAVTTVINVLMQFGLAKYLMREAELTRETLRSLFTVNVLMSLVYVVSILIGAVAAQHLFGSREVGNFLFVFALFPLFAMMEFIPAALCAREMRFGIIAIMSVVRSAMIALVTIILAWLGFAYMSFAWAQVLSWVVTSICFNIALWRPDVWRLRFTGIRSIVHFGTQMIGISGIAQINTRLGEMTLGSLLGLGQLGLYSRAASLPATLYSNVFGAGSNVLFSRMSIELRETGSFDRTYLRFMRLLLGLLWPMMIGLAVLAQPIIAILYGAKWQAAATPLSLLMIASAISVAIGMTAEIFILSHRTREQVRIETFRAIFGYAAFAAGAMVSLTIAAAAKVAEALFAFLLYRKPMRELVGGERGALRRAYGEGLLVTLVAVGPALLLMLWSGFSPATPIGLIAAAIGAGVAAWAFLLVWLQHPLFQEAARAYRLAR
ncbi:oligosaccharide flippase family protein [Sphingomonas humi]|uniref:Lipopolysaccharide biosynthesis protein n=1 Tax=Sphingomonas humi TaxID=335630 RepID=A0ABP7RQ78_9SPHN